MDVSQEPLQRHWDTLCSTVRAPALGSSAGTPQMAAGSADALLAVRGTPLSGGTNALLGQQVPQFLQVGPGNGVVGLEAQRL